MSESKLGEQCEYGALKRQCLICELEAELSAALQRAEKAEAELANVNKECLELRKELKHCLQKNNAVQVMDEYLSFQLPSEEDV